MYSIFENELNVQADYGNHHGDNYTSYINLVLFVHQNQLKEYYNLPVEEIESRGYRLIISTTHINFLREVCEGEKVIVKTQIDNFSGGACNVNFWIHKKNEKKIAADGYFVYTLKSNSYELPDQFPDDFIARLSI